ncbi:thiazole synthase [Sulfobacillus acidophilus TPY]|uniref:Thiazole synthase n=1 Tax=Sulfobacillus acidophilus (strain ATCC 700253 / DSM 10332 / NAL) TaxID=679936 RepID=G8TVV6_SULAD|nr:thiazole synthase [Sulfobacillus acidophilus TPY]AEW04800.1 thiazole-phosphate synthase [Sulfobacillus acidophilus DSM 10332]
MMEEELDQPIRVGDYTFRSRLFVGTGKYSGYDVMREAVLASGTELVTVALRRVNLANPNEPSLLDFLPSEVTVLPNTAGCYTVEDAVMVAELARATGIGSLIKLEVIGDPTLLWPDPVLTLRATEKLVGLGFTVMVYTTPDPVLARHLEEAGAAAVMPLGSPIGSGQGILDVEAIWRIKERVTRVPVVVDAGIGGAADAAVAMEAGADAVLVNTAIAQAQDPVAMAQAMQWAVKAGRQSFLAGRMPKRPTAVASSPETGKVSHA